MYKCETTSEEPVVCQTCQIPMKEESAEQPTEAQPETAPEASEEPKVETTEPQN